MEVLYRSCCGVDVHKKFLVACLLVVDESGHSHKEARRFSTMTGDLLACIDWLEQAHCTAIAMESTGVYWHAPHNLMEGRFEQVIVVNAEHLKRVPGHKTDLKDAEWIAELLQIGLLKPSFIPPRSQRELRHLTRLRTTLTKGPDPVHQSASKGLRACQSQIEFRALRRDGTDQPPDLGSHRGWRRQSRSACRFRSQAGSQQTRAACVSPFRADQ